MTDREKAIVMAYTGATMLTGDKFSIFHKYIEDICGRPIYTHEIAFVAEEIKEKSRADFIELCREETRACDCISRIVAEIEACKETEEPHLCDYRHHRNEGIDAALSIVEKYIQEPCTGHWIETGNMGNIDIDNVRLYQEMCDKCKGLSYFRKSADKLIGAKNCPNCGAKMEVEHE